MWYPQYQWDWRLDTVTILLLSGKPPEELCDTHSSPPLPAALETLFSMNIHKEKHQGIK